MAGATLQDIKDFHDVVHLLEEHPEWRADLRRLVLTDELLALPQQVTRLTEQVTRLTEQMGTLTEIAQRMSVDVGRLKGDGLEVRYTLRGVPSLTRALRRPVSLSAGELDALLEEAETRGLLSEAESEEIARADLVIRGKQRGTGTDVYLVIEISWGVGIEDVQRAAARAALLAKTELHTIPAVAGEWVTPDAQQLAPGLGVWQFTPSRVVPPTT
ncbi:MAG TPA: hypothetical protein VGX03_21865 [Candidatus Binatia bacterium]|jgi:hypothetical protein|nr:hypothetical protein [Candidatus Binatia bacterium]